MRTLISILVVCLSFLLGKKYHSLTTTDIPLIPVCQDEHDRCWEWANMGECEKNEDYMKKQCKKSCKVCVDTEEELEQDSL